jgi:hypothetical protein
MTAVCTPERCRMTEVVMMAAKSGEPVIVFCGGFTNG